MFSSPDTWSCVSLRRWRRSLMLALNIISWQFNPTYAEASVGRRGDAAVTRRAQWNYNLFTTLRTPSITLTELKFIKSPSLHFDNFR